jgi:hypothetical protein
MSSMSGYDLMGITVYPNLNALDLGDVAGSA